jgi:putative MATE family efflux protein
MNQCSFVRSFPSSLVVSPIDPCDARTETVGPVMATTTTTTMMNVIPSTSMARMPMRGRRATVAGFGQKVQTAQRCVSLRMMKRVPPVQRAIGDAPRAVGTVGTSAGMGTTRRVGARTRASVGEGDGGGDFEEASTVSVSAPLPPLLRMSTPRAVWYVGWPTTLTGLMRSFFPLTDTFWVGKLGITELNALCSNSFAGWMLYLLCSIVAYGVQNRVSVKVGAEKFSEVGAVLRDGLYGALVTYGFLAALVPFTAAYTSTLGIACDGTFAIGQSHLKASLLGAVGLCFSNILEATLRGFGSMKPALWVTLLMVVCNIVLDPLFIFGVGPFPKLGVAGAAVGTSISNCIGAFLYYRMLVKDFEVKIPITLPNMKALKDIISIGAPIAVAGIVFAMVYVGLGRILTGLDEYALTAMGLGQQFENIPYTVTEAFRIGTSTLVGQWMGARNAKRARGAGWNAIAIASFALIPFGVFFIAFAPYLVSFLTSNTIVAAKAVEYMYWNFPIVSFMALECAVEGAFTGTGVTYPVLVIAILLNFSRLPLAAALAPTYGVAGVWFTIVFTQVVKSCLKAVWLEKVFKDLIRDEEKMSEA